MTTWTRQSGNTIELNDEEATIEKALSLGWTKGDKPAADKPKRTRRTKEQMEAAKGK